jgi:hypothetical protein
MATAGPAPTQRETCSACASPRAGVAGRDWSTTRSCRISSNTASWKAFLSRGGNSTVERAACVGGPARRAEKRAGRDLLPAFQGRLLHQAADGEMRQQQTIKFLPHQVRCLAAQDDFGSPQVGLQFVQGGLDLPTFVIERRQFLGRCRSDRGSWSPSDRGARRPAPLPAGNRSPAPPRPGSAGADPAPRDKYGSDTNRPAGDFSTGKRGSSPPARAGRLPWARA